MTFLLREQLMGAHVWIRVFVGPDRDHLALAGECRMDPDQARALHVRLRMADVVVGRDLPALVIESFDPAETVTRQRLMDAETCDRLQVGAGPVPIVTTEGAGMRLTSTAAELARLAGRGIVPFELANSVLAGGLLVVALEALLPGSVLATAAQLAEKALAEKIAELEQGG